MADRYSSRPVLGIGLAFCCLLLLGAMPVIVSGRPQGSGAIVFALWFTVWQFLFSLPALVVECRAGQHHPLSAGLPAGRKARLLAATLFTGVLFGLSTWVYVLAFEKAGAVNAAIALQAYPLLASALEATALGRRKSRAELAFMLLVLAALYYLATNGTGRLEGLSPWFLLALLVPLLWSVAHVILREALVRTPVTPTQVTASRLLVSLVLLVPLTLAIEGPEAIVAPATGWSFQLAAIAMGFAYYLELILWFHAMRHIAVSVASSITVPAPAVTMVLAAVVLGETVSAIQIATIVAIFVGLFGMIYSGRRHF